MKSFKIGVSVIALLAMTAQVSAAEMCDAASSAALKTAAVQQELMVAGLMCQDTGAYNRFVTDYQGELQKSDAALMAYFRQRDGNEAGYDSYKTKLANLAASRSSAQGTRYCASADADFAAATKSAGLSDFIAHDRLLITAPESCAVKFDTVDVAVAGVPSHDLPATPYGAKAQPPRPVAAPARAAIAAAPPRDPYADLPLPPRYDRNGRVIEASDDYYGPGWAPRRRWAGAYNDD